MHISPRMVFGDGAGRRERGEGYPARLRTRWTGEKASRDPDATCAPRSSKSPAPAPAWPTSDCPLWRFPGSRTALAPVIACNVRVSRPRAFPSQPQSFRYASLTDALFCPTSPSSCASASHLYLLAISTVGHGARPTTRVSTRDPRSHPHRCCLSSLLALVHHRRDSI